MKRRKTKKKDNSLNYFQGANNKTESKTQSTLSPEKRFFLQKSQVTDLRLMTNSKILEKFSKPDEVLFLSSEITDIPFEQKPQKRKKPQNLTQK